VAADKAGRASSLFHVTVSVANVGERNVGGSRVPLYVLDASNTIVESNAFVTVYKPCPSTALPASFASRGKTTACLVPLVPQRGRLKAASFRPPPRFTPITWWAGSSSRRSRRSPRRRTAVSEPPLWASRRWISHRRPGLGTMLR
jgi:hypothetical protein